MAKNENSEAAAPSRVGVWFQHHVHSVVFSLGRACRKPWATLLTVMVMALALALPLGLSIALDNLKQFAGSVQQSRDINVFLKGNVDGPGALRLAGQLRDRDDVAEVNVRTPEQGLQELRDAGLGEAIDALNDNPLPSLLVITPARARTTRAWRARWKACPRPTWCSTMRCGASAWMPGWRSARGWCRCCRSCSASVPRWWSATPCAWTSRPAAKRSACCSCSAPAMASSAARSCTWARGTAWAPARWRWP
jgi:hypothetical protein